MDKSEDKSEEKKIKPEQLTNHVEFEQNSKPDLFSSGKETEFTEAPGDKLNEEFSSHSDERLPEKPTRYFAVISQENLPQYIQTGFIGLTSVKDPIHDVQSRVWPKNILFKNEIPKKAMEECGPENCVLQLSKDNFNFEQAVYYSKEPVSMTIVEKIIFFDETAISEFISSYQQFSEIPFDFFKMVVEPSVFASSSEEFSFEFKDSEDSENSL